MKKVLLSMAVTLTASVALGDTTPRSYGNPPDKAVADPNLTMRENAYAPGIGLDQYGRPVVLAPARKGQGGYYGDARIQKRDAFGPGVHMDQYGRPVVIVPK